MEERDVQKFTIYLPTAAYEQLRRIAFDDRTSINKLVINAIEKDLATRAKPGRKGK